jgi:hypothetical protein
MQLKISYIIIAVFIIFYSCSNNYDKDIYSVVINSKVKPLPPPPPPINDDTIHSINKNVIDSLDKVPLSIAVNPFLLDFKGDFTELFTDSNGSKVDYSVSIKKINKKSIGGRESLNFTFLKEDVSDFTETLKKYDGILFLSSIAYNKENDKALVIIGYTTGKLSSSTYLLLLKKNGNKWKITSSRRLSVS